MSANIFNSIRIKNIDNFIESVSNELLYVYIGHSEPWVDENTPPMVYDTTREINAQRKDIMGMKRIQASDVVNVIPRINWTSGSIYDEYTDSINIFDVKNTQTGSFYQFYVFTSESNVYKCISNANGRQSTVMPTGTSIDIITTTDGYRWKYMYTVKSADVQKFVNTTFIPCYTLKTDDGSTQWKIQTNAVSGAIDHITVSDGGKGYSRTTPPRVVVDGDGTGCVAAAEVSSTGLIESISIINSGKDYTHATVKIIEDRADGGIDAKATAIISPTGGHGSDAVTELGAVYVMLHCMINGSEDGALPTNVKYRQAGIISSPLSNDVGVTVEVDNPYLFTTGDTLIGGSSGARGTIHHINKTASLIYVKNTTGVFLVNESISSRGNSTTCSRVQTGVNLPIVNEVVSGASLKPNSGTILYALTRKAVTRSEDQPDRMRFVIGF